MRSLHEMAREINDYAEPRSSISLSIGAGLAMLGAVALVVRAYLPLWLFGMPAKFNPMWPLTVCVGYVLLGLAVLACAAYADRVLGWRSDMSLQKRMLAVTVLIVAATGATTITAVRMVATLLVGRDPYLFGMWALSATLGSAACVCFLLYRSSTDERRRALHLQMEADTLETALAHSELAMLEAQIEPHFLFNTLAHIKRQYRLDPIAAKRMLNALIDYLDKALPALRRNDWTVGNEFDLVRTYLEILKQRFGERLRFAIVISAADRALRLPALSVATLVENAVRHGLTPKAEGGMITVTAAVDQQVLRIDVRDNGIGLRGSTGTGLGLATVRARLRGAFSEQGVLVVETVEDGGVLASIRIPARS
jgi:signal transduction histidine kinase